MGEAFLHDVKDDCELGSVVQVLVEELQKITLPRENSEVFLEVKLDSFGHSSVNHHVVGVGR